MNRGVGVTRAIREGLPEPVVELFALLANLGDLVVTVPVLGLLYLADVLWSIREGDEPLCSDRTAFLIAAVFGGLALVVLLKGAIAAPRPPAELHAIDPSEHGFPSGHTMAATAFWGALALWPPMEQRSLPAPFDRRSARLAIAGVVIAIVAVSRLAVGVHFLVDVLASVGIGAAYLAAIGRLARGNPARAFAVALGIAVAAALATAGSSRALLGLAGTVGAAVGWYVVERPPVRRRLVGLGERA